MLIIIVGIGMMALTVVIQTTGASLWLRYTVRRLENLKRQKKSPNLLLLISKTVVALLSLHILEALLWALFYWQLPGKAGLSNFNDALYFSVVTITTLGYGDITLKPEWQLLSGMEAMVGTVAFGLTTALLFAIIQKSWKYQYSEKRGEKRGQSKVPE